MQLLFALTDDGSPGCRLMCIGRREGQAHDGRGGNRARAELIDRGIDVASVEDAGGGVKYASFTDPNGNTMVLQEMSWRIGDAF